MTKSAARTSRLLWSLAGPSGPMRTADDNGRERAELLRGDALDAADNLLAVIKEEYRPANVKPRDVEIEAAELLSELARDPRVIERLLEAVDSRDTRILALDSLGLSGETAAGAHLAALSQSAAIRVWNEDELVALASAIGLVDGPDAPAGLACLRELSDGRDALREELRKFHGKCT